MTIVYSGAGMISPFFKTMDEAILQTQITICEKDFKDYRLTEFNSTPFLSQKRMMKSISWYQAFGLAALENCKRDSALTPESFDPDEVGVFVGASSASSFDNLNYISAIQASKTEDGLFSETLFGEQCMNSLGTTLLLGLTNNVLCYGSMVLNARGPNSNYMGGEISGQMAVASAVDNIREKRLKCAIAGGYGMNSDEVVMAILKDRGHLKVLPLDAAIFFALENRETAESRSAKILAEHVSEATANVGDLRYLQNPEVNENDVETVIYMIEKCLGQVNLSKSDIGLVFLSGSGIDYIDQAERKALDTFFEKEQSKPAYASLGSVFGNLMEASGLVEIPISKRLFTQKKLPEAIALEQTAQLSESKPFVLILKGSASGDFSCLCIRSL